MIVGFAGTRFMVTEAQFTALLEVIFDLDAQQPITQFLNGFARGADRIATSLVLQFTRAMVVAYPGDAAQQDAADEQAQLAPGRVSIHPVLPYLKRNKLIATRCAQLIAVPASAIEERRSGTWATVRYARAAGPPRTIILPDGSLLRE
jgi:hypothetical protein